jgi:hypothetical protein
MSELLIITNIKKTYIYFDKLLINYPIKELEIKQKIKELIYSLLEFAYKANNEEKNIKRVCFQKEMITKLKLLDFMINVSYEKQTITKKQMLSVGKHLTNINILIRAWIKSDEKSKEFIPEDK